MKVKGPAGATGGGENDSRNVGGSACEVEALADHNNVDDDIVLTDADKAFLDYLAKGAVRLYLARQSDQRGGHGP